MRTPNAATRGARLAGASAASPARLRAPRMRVRPSGSAGGRGRRICLLPMRETGPPANRADAHTKRRDAWGEIGWGERSEPGAPPRAEDEGEAVRLRRRPREKDLPSPYA